MPWFVLTDPAMTYNWAAHGGERWTIPVGMDFGKVFQCGKQSMSWQLGSYYYAARPEGAADWMMRFQITLLFPK